MKKLKLLDTFSGIGGFSYAAEKLVGGFETTQFIEIDPYCQKVLKKHWPNVPIHDDITTYRAELYSADVVCGGFPCQDISVAGQGKGITETSRSGLWFQLIRTIRMVRPKYFILENVSAILANGLDIVLRDIYETGLYECEWCCIPSSFVGACHQRDRFWLIGFPSNSNNNGSFRSEESRSIKETDGWTKKRKDTVRDSKGSGKSTDSRDVQLSSSNTESQFNNVPKSEHLINKKSSTSEFRNSSVTTSDTKSSDWNGNENKQRDGKSRTQEIFRNRNSSQSSHTWRSTKHRLNPNWRQYVSKPCLLRGNDGLRNRVDRLKALGNSVVPQVAAIPLQRVKDIHNQLTSVDR